MQILEMALVEFTFKEWRKCCLSLYLFFCVRRKAVDFTFYVPRLLLEFTYVLRYFFTPPRYAVGTYVDNDNFTFSFPTAIFCFILTNNCILKCHQSKENNASNSEIIVNIAKNTYRKKKLHLFFIPINNAQLFFEFLIRVSIKEVSWGLPCCSNG